MTDTINTLPTSGEEWIKLGQYYLSLGWSIIPVGIDKKPILGSWKEFQTRQPTTVELQEWSKLSSLTGFALVTGKISGIIVLDLDTGSAFDTTTIPHTIQSQTGSGGYHYFFKMPDQEVRNSASKLSEHTDIRGEGGFAILPPSKHPNGNQYHWMISPEDVATVKLPESLLQEICTLEQKRKEPSAITKEGNNIFEGVGEGKRNDSATRVVGVLMKYIPKDQWESTVWNLLRSWNQLNQPPLGEAEIRSVYDSISKIAVNDDQDRERESQAKTLVGLVRSTSIKLYTNQFHEPVLTLPQSPFVVCDIDSKTTRLLLYKLYWNAQQNTPSSEGVNTAIKMLESFATYDSSQIEVFNRVGRKDGCIFYDLGDDKHVVKITENGWTIETESPIHFRRFSHQKAQVIPIQGGNLPDLFSFINVHNEQQKLLVLTFLVVSLIPDISRAMLIVHGDQGSAKSTLLRLLRELIDPSAVALMTPHDSSEELAQMASHNYAVFFDNLSDISQNLSDTLCRFITGDGFTKRQLYSNDEDILYSFKRVVGICGINQVATKPDLLDRSIILALDRIPDDERKEDEQLEREFKPIKPYLLGSLFDAVATTLKVTPTLKLHYKPRMADHFKYATAAATHFGYTEHQLFDCFKQNVKLQNEEAIDASAVAQTIIEFMKDKESWRGTSSELFEKLDVIAESLKVNKGFPKTPSWLWRRVKDVRSNLGAYGIIIVRDEGVSKATYISINKNASTATIASTSSDKLASGGGNNASNGSMVIEEISEDELKSAFA